MNKNVKYLGLLLMIAVSITYSNHFQNSFHFDDCHTIVNNVYIRDIGNIPKIFTSIEYFGNMPGNQGYRPVVTASTAIDYWLGGGYFPFYFHLSMFIVFLLQGVCMFFIFLKIFNISYKHEWTKYLALFCVGWYMLHPGNAETINYIISRSDSFSTFFVILAFVCYMYSKFCRKYFLYLIPAALGILSKEPGAMFSGLLFFYILFFENKVSLTKIFTKQRKQFFNAIIKAIPAILFTIAGLYIVIYIVHKQTFDTGANPEGLYLKYILTQPYVLFMYFYNFFLPVSLNSDPEFAVFSNFSDIRMYFGFAFVILMFVLAFVTSKNEKYRPIAFGILWFFIASIPTSLNVSSQAANSHRLFFPYVGLSISVSWVIFLFMVKIRPVFEKTKFNKSIIAGALLILCGYAYGTYQRNEVWKNEETLWYDIIQKSPENPRAMMNYGLTLMAKGQYSEAEFYYRKALAIWPNWPYLHINMGILKGATNQIAEAEQYYLSAIRVSSSPLAYYYYSKFLSAQKRSKEAIPYLQHAIKVSPGDMESCYLLMSIYTELEYWDQLQSLATETLQIVPGDTETLSYIDIAKGKKTQVQINEEQTKNNPTPENYLNLSLLYYQKGLYEKCIDACREAIKLRPDYAAAYNNICSAYNALGKYEEGIKACEKAIAIQPDFQLAKNNLNWAKSQIK
ncbi:MAG: tetratricopeptide repeat protein [Bacteroidales bacterium]